MDPIDLVLLRLAADGWRLWLLCEGGPVLVHRGPRDRAVSDWAERGRSSGLVLMDRCVHHPAARWLLESGPAAEGPGWWPAGCYLL